MSLKNTQRKYDEVQNKIKEAAKEERSLRTEVN